MILYKSLKDGTYLSAEKQIDEGERS